jgi:hypothetical protein
LEEAFLMGFSGGFEQGKPETALPELNGFITANGLGVNCRQQFFLKTASMPINAFFWFIGAKNGRLL